MGVNPTSLQLASALAARAADVGWVSGFGRGQVEFETADGGDLRVGLGAITAVRVLTENEERRL